MVLRVNFGACKQCGSPILYQGAEYCSPQCHTASMVTRCSRCGVAIGDFADRCASCEKFNPCELCGAEVENARVCAACVARVESSERQVLVLDNETELFTEACAAPPIVCTGFCDRDSYHLFHVNEAYPAVRAALESDRLLVGHNVAYDMVGYCAQWPDLMPLVVEVYEQDRVTDTMLREKLIDIANGTYFDGIEYPLDSLAKRRCGLQLRNGEWQLRFAELKPYPVEQWPQEARDYLAGDLVSTFAVFRDQQREVHWLADQYRQARAAFVFELISAWGLHTDPIAVREYKEKLEREFATIAEEMLQHGLMRRESHRKKATGLIETKLVRTTKAVQARVEEAYLKAGRVVPRTAPSSKHQDGQVCTDADTCERSKDPVLKNYAELSSIGTMLSNFVPTLERGTTTPLHVHFTSLLVTGRTSSSPNVQNLPTDEGVRECFVPRPGYVYIISDYAGIELRTWAQICYSLFGESKLREALNSGVDPHTKMASLILGIPYEQAVEDYKANRKGLVYLPRQAGKAGNFGFPGGAGYDSWREYARTAYKVDIPKDDPSAPIDAKRVKGFWREAWTEAEPYHDWIAQQCEARGGLALIEQAYVKRFRGGCRFTEASNTLFQGLAADLAKRALWLVMKACYVTPSSFLYNSRIVNFVHDELLTETPDTPNAHDAAMEQERLMLQAAKEFLPDITNIECETYLARRWSKAGKPIKDANGRLVPWDRGMK